MMYCEVPGCPAEAEFVVVLPAAVRFNLHMCEYHYDMRGAL